MAGVSLALGMAVGVPALAVDQPIDGRKLVLKEKKASVRLRLVAKDDRIEVPGLGGADDPRSVGARLEVVNPGTGEAAVLEMPAAGWRANAKGTALGFKAKRVPGGAADVKAAVVKHERQIKLKGATTGITLDEAEQGSLAATVVLGTLRYCALFGGTVAKDVPGRFKARDASAPTTCAAGPVSTTTSVPTTSMPGSTSTSVSTTSIPASTSTTVACTSVGGLMCDGFCPDDQFCGVVSPGPVPICACM